MDHRWIMHSGDDRGGHLRRWGWSGSLGATNPGVNDVAFAPKRYPRGNAGSPCGAGQAVLSGKGTTVDVVTADVAAPDAVKGWVFWGLKPRPSS
jgi:hypothetical protein